VAAGEATLEQLDTEEEDRWDFTAQLEGEPFGLPAELMDRFLGNTPLDEVHAVFDLVERQWGTGLVHLPGEVLPRGLVRVEGERPLVTQNCSACHSGVVNGNGAGARPLR
jgi:hypothetical protein